MQKLFLLLISLFIFANVKISACAGGDDADHSYYNLFMQEIIDDPQYYPFLLSLDYAYYSSNTGNFPNENIEEWQNYLSLSYDDTYYLVFKTSKEDIDRFVLGKTVEKDPDFMTSSFIKKHKQTLLYLSYAKYLEPYMRITISDSDSWGYYRPEEIPTAGNLDYDKVVLVLQRSYKAESDKELKLRYAYQLVRFAHYNRKYEEAVRFFDIYVESLDYRPAMYYHALSQKAGAEKGIGDLTTANIDFFKVFVHSKDLKESALTSIKFGNNADFNEFLKQAKSDKEKNDAYLLLGFISFNNPLNEIVKITAESPDAIQAKVLMARAVNTLERNIFPGYWGTSDEYAGVKDKRYPVIRRSETVDFFNATLQLSTRIANSPKVQDKDYWNLTTAYLLFLNKDFSESRRYLNLVKSINDKYITQKKNLAMYIDMCELPEIDNKAETYLYEKYKDILIRNTTYDYYDDNNNGYADYCMKNFMIDVLANRYFLQKDYAKSFLLSNNITDLEYNPRLDLLSDIESFYRKSNKNEMEKYIESGMYTTKINKENAQNYIDYLRGIIYLTKGEYDKALAVFSDNDYTTRDHISAKIFGYNRIECFECDEDLTMESDYLSDFSFIKDDMNERELASALSALQKRGLKNDESAAKANYLIGNFIYNTTSTGYYRHVLRFDGTNGNGEKFRYNAEKNVFDGIYFKYYPMYYDDPVFLSQKYLEKAFDRTKDNELKARILFALSKCEQAVHDSKSSRYYYDINGDDILIQGRVYFKELTKLDNTRFYDEVVTNCKYFDYYISRYL